MKNRTLIGQIIGKYYVEESLGRGGMAALNHAHIVSVYDFDVQDGIYYIVMEFVSGGTG
jgi:serine/threonine protein kinase